MDLVITSVINVNMDTSLTEQYAYNVNLVVRLVNLVRHIVNPVTVQLF